MSDKFLSPRENIILFRRREGIKVFRERERRRRERCSPLKIESFLEIIEQQDGTHHVRPCTRRWGRGRTGSTWKWFISGGCTGARTPAPPPSTLLQTLFQWRSTNSRRGCCSTLDRIGRGGEKRERERVVIRKERQAERDACNVR